MIIEPFLHSFVLWHLISVGDGYFWPALTADSMMMMMLVVESCAISIKLKVIILLGMRIYLFNPKIILKFFW